MTCKVPDMQTILYTLSEHIETPFIVIAGEMSCSNNLAEFRPAWFGGSGISPARYAMDGNLVTCTTVTQDQHMVIDLGFNANTILHVKITIKRMYYIYIDMSLSQEGACGYVLVYRIQYMLYFPWLTFNCCCPIVFNDMNIYYICEWHVLIILS